MIRRVAVPAALTFLLPILVVAGVSSPTAVGAPSTLPAAASVAPSAELGNDLARLAAKVPFRRFAPSNATVAWGPSFNNPTKGKEANRRNLDRVYRMIQSTKGYRTKRITQCPRRPEGFPNTIKIALYSFSDNRVADALIRAHRRCISVKVLMNDHLTNREVPAFGRLQRALGTNRLSRSWARRCHDGCRGSAGPLHTKMYLFSQTGKARNVVGLGSTNMTGKAATVQWNDLFVWRGQAGLYKNFVKIFDESTRDRRAPSPVERNYVNNGLTTMFWPQPGHNRSNDRVLKALKEVKCTVRPTRGTGFDGHTAVSINIHAMEGERGLYIAQHIVRMRRAGCRVRVLYGLIAPRIHRTFKAGRVPTRRTIFDRDKNGYTDMYTHMKYVGINGVVGNTRAGRVMYTGSENFSQKTVYADEIWQRIPGSVAWRKYQKLFDMIWNSNYYSNPKYAFYQQSSSPIHARMNQYIDPNALKITAEDLEE